MSTILIGRKIEERKKSETHTHRDTTKKKRIIHISSPIRMCLIDARKKVLIGAGS